VSAGSAYRGVQGGAQALSVQKALQRQVAQGQNGQVGEEARAEADGDRLAGGLQRQQERVSSEAKHHPKSSAFPFTNMRSLPIHRSSIAAA